uniref:Transposase n=1 Tax=Steinernema glaseri TaxID=37863 RepID=A0A1I7Z8C5_9BILA
MAHLASGLCLLDSEKRQKIVESGDCLDPASSKPRSKIRVLLEDAPLLDLLERLAILLAERVVQSKAPDCGRFNRRKASGGGH